ncbi:hypothetical protein ACTHGU_00995 [Chitinophagaceae bacterium MMS25-I14]
MSHDTQHHTNGTTEKSSKISASASFWFVLILVGLFIAAVNFVNVESHSTEEPGTEQHHEGAAAESHETAAEPAAATPAADTAHQTAAVADTTHAAAH